MSYQVMPGKTDPVRLIAVISPGPVVAEYEKRCAKQATNPELCFPAPSPALAAVIEDEPALIVNRNGGSITTAIVRK